MNINIVTNKGDDGEKLPYVNPMIYEHLEKAYSLGSLMTHNFKTNDEHIGYIKGVMDVLGHIKMMANLNDEE
jgi:hypothetical protein|nr:MAG TPA: hypothetical protein [Bacteriophage sp.]